MDRGEGDDVGDGDGMLEQDVALSGALEQARDYGA